MHYVAPSYDGEVCGMCLRDEDVTVAATHKVGEEMLGQETVYSGDDINPYTVTVRHNLTQYVCCRHFAQIMGGLAQQWCQI